MRLLCLTAQAQACTPRIGPTPDRTLWRKQHLAAIAAGLTLALAAVLLTLVALRQVPGAIVALAYLCVVFGGGVGATELASRYRDAPGTVIGGLPGLLYMALNGGASLGAFGLIRLMGWRFGIDASAGDSLTLRATQFLVASFGAAALFRTSLFTVKAGDEEIGIGPSAVLTVALNAADRAVDRQRALFRGAEVRQVMQNVDFDKAVVNLVPYCLQTALQNVSSVEQTAVANVVKSLQADTSGMSRRAKSMVLGGALMSVVGYDVLYWAVKELCDDIKLPNVGECIPEARLVV